MRPRPKNPAIALLQIARLAWRSGDPAAVYPFARPIGKPWSHLTLGLWAATAIACQDDPSVQMRWAIVQPGGQSEGAPLLRSPAQCTAAGLGQVEVVILRTDGSSSNAAAASYRTRCFQDAFVDEEGRHNGPSLDPGKYQVALSGLRRNGETWDYSPPPGQAATSPYFTAYAATGGKAAFASATFEVKSGKTTDLGTLVLVAPPTCDDGIDNDRDGQVDNRDVQCQLAQVLGTFAHEDGGADDVLFSFDLTAFDRRVQMDGWLNLDLPDLAIRVATASTPDAACSTGTIQAERLEGVGDFSDCERITDDLTIRLSAEKSCVITSTAAATRLAAAAREPGCYAYDLTWGYYNANSGQFEARSKTQRKYRLHPQASTATALLFDLAFTDVDPLVRAGWSRSLTIKQQLTPARLAVQACAPAVTKPSLQLVTHTFHLRLFDHLGNVRSDLLRQWTFDGVVPGEAAVIDAEGFMAVPCLTKAILPAGLTWDGEYRLDVVADTSLLGRDDVVAQHCLATAEPVVLWPTLSPDIIVSPFSFAPNPVPLACEHCSTAVPCSQEPSSQTPTLRCVEGRCVP